MNFTIRDLFIELYIVTFNFLQVTHMYVHNILHTYRHTIQYMHMCCYMPAMFLHSKCRCKGTCTLVHIRRPYQSEVRYSSKATSHLLLVAHSHSTRVFKLATRKLLYTLFTTKTLMKQSYLT